MVDKELTSGHIQVVEHGSGIYSSDTDFNSQRLNKSTEAEYQPTTFNFSDGFGVNFSSKWMQGICSKDQKAYNNHQRLGPSKILSAAAKDPFLTSANIFPITSHEP